MILKTSQPQTNNNKSAGKRLLLLHRPLGRSLNGLHEGTRGYPGPGCSFCGKSIGCTGLMMVIKRLAGKSSIRRAPAIGSGAHERIANRWGEWATRGRGEYCLWGTGGAVGYRKGGAIWWTLARKQHATAQRDGWSGAVGCLKWGAGTSRATAFTWTKG